MLMTLFASVAMAAVHTENEYWPVKSAAPSYSDLTNAGNRSEIEISWCEGTDCPLNTSTGTFASDWSKVTCEARYNATTGRNSYVAWMNVADSAWPTSSEWAAHTTVSCEKTTGGNTYKGVLAIVDNPNPKASAGAAISLTTGITLTFGTAGTGGDQLHTAAGHFVYKLPSNTYVQSEFLAVKGGVAWTGVTCQVDEATTGTGSGTTDYLGIQVTSAAAEGTGSCPVTRMVGGVPTVSNVPLVLDRP